MTENEASPLEAAEAAADLHFRQISSVLAAAREALNNDDRNELSRSLRKRAADLCTEVGWVLCGRLLDTDKDVLRALIGLEQIRGETFRTTQDEIRSHVASSHMWSGQVSVALRRLNAIGVITKTTGLGKHGTRVRINWDQLPPLEHKAA